ncbi:hypothetical protein Pelo_6812 [Pelomyxa schiedti]|nr:hypothetical protein Pelo_6812 [Pelomyxa schiedti]
MLPNSKIFQGFFANCDFSLVLSLGALLVWSMYTLPLSPILPDSSFWIYYNLYDLHDPTDCMHFRACSFYLLLNLRRKVTYVSNYFFTALHLACRNGKVQIVRQILSSAGVDTHIKNKDGETALECSTSDEVRQLFQAMCPATPTTIARTVSTPKTPQQQQPPQPQPPSAANKPPSSSSYNSPQPTMTATKPTTTPNTIRTSQVISKALEGGYDAGSSSNNVVEKRERDFWEMTAKQKNDEITELKARITQLEDLLHDERKCRQVEEQTYNEMKQFYEDESAKTLKTFCDERAYDQQRFTTFFFTILSAEQTLKA